MNKDITPLNDKKQAHGLWEWYYYTGDLMYKCFFHNGKIVGYEETYWSDGQLQEKRYYI